MKTATGIAVGVAAGVVAWLVIGLAIVGFVTLVTDDDQPADRPAVSERITEDDPRWNCRTMGNRQCGPVGHPAGE